jgi:hypothetical protein
MTKLVYQGGSANLQLLAEELREDQAVSASCEIRLLREEQSGDSLYNGELAQIIISITAGVSTNLIIDAIHAAVNRARDRGPVKAVNQGPAKSDEGESVGCDEVDQPS